MKTPTYVKFVGEHLGIRYKYVVCDYPIEKSVKGIKFTTATYRSIFSYLDPEWEIITEEEFKMETL